jgi:PAS domain S-box-containing protein
MKRGGRSSSARWRARLYPTGWISARSAGSVVTEVVHVPHRAEDGTILGIYAVVRDITERKRSERELSESEHGSA